MNLMRFNKMRYVLMFILSLLQGYCFSQSKGLNSDLINYSSALNQSSLKIATEKLYLQFDKPYYAVGDTIWFKAYLLNSYLAPDSKSGMLHIDIANDSNKVIKQYLLPVQGGITWGNIGLEEKEFATGTYTLRAYTNWMRNLGNDCFFYKSFYISSANENNLLVNSRFKTSTVNGNKVLTAKLLFSDMNKVPFAVQPLQLQITSGSKQLDKQKLQTGVDGIVDVSFQIPQKTSGLTIVAESIGKGKRAVIPVGLNRDENIDVQFLPEGGNLVAGLPAHIAFKAIGEDGKGVQISGIITDHNRQQVAEFKALHNGMGSFNLAVKTGESYTARVTLPGGAVKDFALPVIKNSGTVLNIKNPVESDYLEVEIGASSDIVQAGNSYFFIGKARGVVCYAAIVDFADSNFVKRKISKHLFPTGIAHFTIMTTKYQPLNERLVFVDRHDNLHIKISPDKPYCNTRDSVALQIKVTDDEGNPVPGDFSLAVTDDAQVKADTLKDENILTRMLLTSDLKGYIEEPGYYLSTKTTEAWQALDNLLLTQGWIGYHWGQVLNPPVISFQPENNFVVKGSVTNVFNKPVKASHILLFSKSPSILKDTLTDENGKFVFDRLPRVDTPIFVLKAVNKNGKSFNVRINVDEMNPPDFTKPTGPAMTPWYVNSDTTLLSYNKNNALIKQQKNFPVGGHLLKEVNIKAKKIVKGSQNLNGPGEADIVLDEKDMEAAGKKTLLQLLEENVKGFREGTFVQDLSSNRSLKAIKDGYLMAYVTDDQYAIEWYFIYGKPLKVIVDGISAAQFIISGSTFYNPTAYRDMTNYLMSHSAEDVKGIEIIHTAGYAAAYLSRYDPGNLIMAALDYNQSINISPSDIAFIEITTRGGHGPVIDNTPGMYLYKPLPLSWPKQFYKPKYTVKDTANHISDLRSTLDWEPNVKTDANGEASIWFYTADKASTYTVTIEGMDMNGRLGYKTKKIKIGGIAEKTK